MKQIARSISIHFALHSIIFQFFSSNLPIEYSSTSAVHLIPTAIENENIPTTSCKQFWGIPWVEKFPGKRIRNRWTSLLTSEFPSSPFLPSVGPSINVFIYRLISEIFLPGLIEGKVFAFLSKESLRKAAKGTKRWRKMFLLSFLVSFREISSRLGTWARTASRNSFPVTDSVSTSSRVHFAN